MARHNPPSDTSLRIAAIVVTYRRLDKLRDTVTRLLSEPIDHLIVFDNASGDGTAEWLAQVDDPRLIFRCSDRNLGGAGGFSAAMQEARDLIDADWTVVMDDDGRPLPGAISAFRKMDLAGWDALGAAVFHPDGTVCEMNRPYRNPFWRGHEFLRTLGGKGRAGFHLQDDAYAANAPMIEVDMSSFVGLFLSRHALDVAGVPDPRLFIYGDDQLYTLNMRRKGLKIGFAPRIRFEHDTEAKQGSSGLILSPLWKVYYMYRNALIAYRVAAGALFWPLVPVLLIKWRRKARDYGAEGTRFRKILSVAVRDGLAGRLNRSHDEVLALSQQPCDPADR
ncbi:glycosyltransferase [Paracoccus sp. Z330]|uniref:Glycosyltransferase n=1 Tax=Paracoccus onchidii TaxID=3017813 RepID=A0ABT4ZFU6_9RHOB|nr:glycosyltransferase [Paracoccus onchidii]MDB6178191.1 glycosyltransferase [Paracoccus onchidii]